MFSIAFLIGVYANIIMLLGMAGLLTKPIISVFTGVYIFLSIIFWRKFDEKFAIKTIWNELTYHIRATPVAVVLIAAATGFVLIGALAPELAFDALWYHVTLPKLYLAEHGLKFFSGGLLYYSPMPQFGEMLYTASLALHSEILAKLVHASFLLLICLVIYILGKNYTNRKLAIIGVLIFLSNIVVLWEATTAYIDLIRAFFEVMSFWGLLQFIKTNERKWLVESAVLMGLAIETKLIGVASLGVMLLLLFFFSFQKKLRLKLRYIVMFAAIAMLIPLPWFVYSFFQTGNPIYPLFSGYQIHLGQDTLAFPGVFLDPITVFFTAADPVSPLYLMIFPLYFLVRHRLSPSTNIFFAYVIFSLIAWTLTPRTGGGRFLVPYLPVFSVAAVVILSQCKNILYKISIASIIVVTFTSIFYRGIATKKYLPVVLGMVSKDHFLQHNLNYSFGDFYDIDGEIKKRVLPSQKVLLYGFHNLYYMDVPFVHESWVKKGDRFDFIATQGAKLPERFKYWQPVYTNTTTGVTLYTVGHQWIY